MSDPAASPATSTSTPNSKQSSPSPARGVALLGTLFFLWLPDDGWYDATRAVLLVSIGLYAVSFLAVFLLPMKAREESLGH